MGISVIIMAGGIGKRMNSKKVKVLHNILGHPIIYYVFETAKSINPEKIVIVYGKKGAEIKDMFQGEEYAFQEEPRGTGDAVKIGMKKLKNISGDVLILSGDVPLLTKKTIDTLQRYHKDGNYDVTILTFIPEKPDYYGRIVREGNEILKIVEYKDATSEEKKIKEVNSGIYIFKKNTLEMALASIKNENTQGEYYLTDTIEVIKKRGGKIGGVVVEDPKEVSGINTREELIDIIEYKRKKIIKNLMEDGVTIIMPHTVYIEDNVKIGRDTTIYPFNIIMGDTIIGEDSIIESFCYIKDALVKKGQRIPANTIINGEK